MFTNGEAVESKTGVCFIYLALATRWLWAWLVQGLYFID